MAHALLQEKTALITGAGKGLGRAIAKQFAEEGALVALFDKSESVLETASEVGSDKFSEHRVGLAS